MKKIIFFLIFVTFLTYSQDDDLIYLRYRKDKDTINLYCVNKNPVDYFIYVNITNRDIVPNPKQLKRIVKVNDSLFITQLTSKFKLDDVGKDIILYKKALIGLDSAQVFKDFKTPTETFLEKNQLIVFTKKNCPKCSEITNFLNLEKLPSKQIDVEHYQNIRKYEEIVDFFKRDDLEEGDMNNWRRRD